MKGRIRNIRKFCFFCFLGAATHAIIVLIVSNYGVWLSMIVSTLGCCYYTIKFKRVCIALREINKLQKEHQVYLAGVMQDPAIWDKLKKKGRFH